MTIFFRLISIIFFFSGKNTQNQIPYTTHTSNGFFFQGKMPKIKCTTPISKFFFQGKIPKIKYTQQTQIPTTAIYQ